MPQPTDPYRKIYAVVARIPRGRVASYGQVAALAGMPRHARQVGYALKILPPEARVPWFRVVNGQGRISSRANAFDHESLQEQLLLREGVRVVAGKVALGVYGWQAGKLSVRRQPGKPRTPAKPRTHGKTR